MTDRVLVINPGSTSTKVAVFRGTNQVVNCSIKHLDEELQQNASPTSSLRFRKQCIERVLREQELTARDFDAIVARGGIIKPVPGGVYLVCSGLIDDLLKPRYQHASNMGGVLAHAFAAEGRCPAFIVDPPVVDELSPIARVSGHKMIERVSLFHALNQKAVARRACRDLGLDYGRARLIVAHLGGGVSVGAHCEGRVVDVNNGLIGEGPFSPERSGGLPVMDVIGLLEREPGIDLQSLVAGQGGLKSYLGTADALAVEARIEAGDSYAELIYDAMCYQVAKEIAGLAAVLSGRLDAVIITGGLARSEWLVHRIRERVAFLGRLLVYPGEDEMLALAEGALRVLAGKEEPLHYCQVVHRECPDLDFHAPPEGNTL